MITRPHQHIVAVGVSIETLHMVKVYIGYYPCIYHYSLSARLGGTTPQHTDNWLPVPETATQRLTYEALSVQYDQ